MNPRRFAGIVATLSALTGCKDDARVGASAYGLCSGAAKAVCERAERCFPVQYASRFSRRSYCETQMTRNCAVGESGGLMLFAAVAEGMVKFDSTTATEQVTALGARPCEEGRPFLREGEGPTREMFPGLLEAGMTAPYSLFCTSGASSSARCGVCGAPDPNQASCPPCGAKESCECTESGCRCIALPGSGESCHGWQCQLGLECKQFDWTQSSSLDGGSRCNPLPSTGQACTGGCAGEGLCVAFDAGVDPDAGLDARHCETFVLGGNGERCSAFGVASTVCAAELECVTGQDGTGTCRPRPGVGESCRGRECPLGLGCKIQGEDEAVCVAMPGSAAGEACDINFGCSAPGLFCGEGSVCTTEADQIAAFRKYLMCSGG